LDRHGSENWNFHTFKLDRHGSRNFQKESSMASPLSKCFNAILKGSSLSLWRWPLHILNCKHGCFVTYWFSDHDAIKLAWKCLNLWIRSWPHSCLNMPRSLWKGTVTPKRGGGWIRQLKTLTLNYGLFFLTLAKPMQKDKLSICATIVLLVCCYLYRKRSYTNNVNAEAKE